MTVLLVFLNTSEYVPENPSLAGSYLKELSGVFVKPTPPIKNLTLLKFFILYISVTFSNATVLSLYTIKTLCGLL